MTTIREKLKDGLNSKEVLKQHSNCVYVLTFIGNIMASEVEQLRDQISFLIQIAQPADEIVVRLTSPRRSSNSIRISEFSTRTS